MHLADIYLFCVGELHLINWYDDNQILSKTHLSWILYWLDWVILTDCNTTVDIYLLQSFVFVVHFFLFAWLIIYSWLTENFQKWSPKYLWKTKMLSVHATIQFQCYLSSNSITNLLKSFLERYFFHRFDRMPMTFIAYFAQTIEKEPNEVKSSLRAHFILWHLVHFIHNSSMNAHLIRTPISPAVVSWILMFVT